MVPTRAETPAIPADAALSSESALSNASPASASSAVLASSAVSGAADSAAAQAPPASPDISDISDIPDISENSENSENPENPADSPPLFAPHILARANELLTQARVIERLRGVDALALLRTDVQGRQRVLSGEWDLTDLVAAAPAPAPLPVRSPNGAVGAMDVHAMSGDQFASLNRMLAGGHVLEVG